MIGFEFYADNTATATEEVVFIPATDLVGIVAGEFANAEPLQVKKSKSVYGIFNTILANGLTNALGLSVSSGNSQGGVNGLSGKPFSFTIEYASNLKTNQVGVLPLPTIGDQVGVGDVSINSIFPNAVKVAAAANVPSEGMGIPTSLLVDFGSPAHGTLTVNNDARSWFGALLRYIVDQYELRSATVASALTAKNLQATAPFNLTAVATDAVNPTTGFASTELKYIDTFSRTMTFSIQRLENESTQTFDVNVVTA